MLLFVHVSGVRLLVAVFVHERYVCLWQCLYMRKVSACGGEDLCSFVGEQGYTSAIFKLSVTFLFLTLQNTGQSVFS